MTICTLEEILKFTVDGALSGHRLLSFKLFHVSLTVHRNIWCSDWSFPNCSAFHTMHLFLRPYNLWSQVPITLFLMWSLKNQTCNIIYINNDVLDRSFSKSWCFCFLSHLLSFKELHMNVLGYKVLILEFITSIILLLSFKTHSHTFIYETAFYMYMKNILISSSKKHSVSLHRKYTKTCGLWQQTEVFSYARSTMSDCHIHIK